MLRQIRKKINIKYSMVAYLGLLLLLSALSTHLPLYFLAGSFIVMLYTFFDLIWTRLRDHVWYMPVSSWISGLVLSVVALTNPSILQIIALPFLASISKQLFHFGKSRHVWNPAGLSMTVVNLFTPAISWWAVSWGTVPTIIVALVGSFILWRLERWHVALSFFGSFALFFVLLFGWESGFLAALTMIGYFLITGPVIFFATVMLIEPVTSGFPTRSNRAVYGALVGLFAAVITFLARLVPQISLDPLITGLLLGNLSASLFFLPSRRAAIASTPPRVV